MKEMQLRTLHPGWSLMDIQGSLMTIKLEVTKMEIRRTTQSSNIQAEIETTEAPQQPTISRGVGDASDSFVIATQRDPLSISPPPDPNSASTQLASDDSLQKQLALGLAQAT